MGRLGSLTRLPLPTGWLKAQSTGVADGAIDGLGVAEGAIDGLGVAVGHTPPATRLTLSTLKLPTAPPGPIYSNRIACDAPLAKAPTFTVRRV